MHSWTPCSAICPLAKAIHGRHTARKKISPTKLTNEKITILSRKKASTLNENNSLYNGSVVFI